VSESSTMTVMPVHRSRICCREFLGKKHRIRKSHRPIPIGSSIEAHEWFVLCPSKSTTRRTQQLYEVTNTAEKTVSQHPKQRTCL